MSEFLSVRKLAAITNCLALSCIAIALGLTPTPIFGDEQPSSATTQPAGKQTNSKRSLQKLRPLLQQFCFECHGNDESEANVNLERMISDRSIAPRFKTWEKAIDMLETKRMPPKDMLQPSNAQRQTLIRTIRGELDSFVRRYAGDPGRVVIRRLTSAEYAYTIQDLTGLDLQIQNGFVSDAVGGEGFTNVGEVQFIQDSTLERYLEAAKLVAAHAVIGSGPLQFYRDPGKTGLELSAIHRIQAIYRAHGFRTGAGEGANPFGLDQYPTSFFATWQFQHRKKLGMPNVTLKDLAAKHKLSTRFLEHIWDVFNNSHSTFPTSVFVAKWQHLPIPNGEKTSELEARAQSECDKIYNSMRYWQRLLAMASSDEEEAAVLTAGSIRVLPKHSFKADIHWAEDAKTGLAEFSVSIAGQQHKTSSIVIWKNAQVRFRQTDKRWTKKGSLHQWFTPRTARRLKLGQHPHGPKLDPHDFIMSTGDVVEIEFRIPEKTTDAQVFVDVQLQLGNRQTNVVRCSISDGVVEGETVAETGNTSVLLGDPKSESFADWKSGVVEFASKLPEVSHREPAPSDRDPIPAPFDNTYNKPERNLFHYIIKYHRDDDFLVSKMLHDSTHARLDEAWTDLLTSFDYHDTFLQFVAKKYDLKLKERSIADLDATWIDGLSAEPRAFVRWLHDDYVAAQRARKTAEPRHIEQVLRFAQTAWRRPLSDNEKERLQSFYTKMQNDFKLDHTKAMRALLARVLIAPEFLYRAESPHDRIGIVRLSDWELASRLSYFLWSSVPDAELRRAAAAGTLHETKTLTSQVRRMLRDPKSRRLATEFFGQWFGFYRFDEHRGVDSERFPDFTTALRNDMYNEAVSFFEYIIRENRPVGEILFADYSFLNRRLARHYGIDAKLASKEYPTRVNGLGEFHRGGLLGLGAVLTVTSAPLRTSPVKRGNWILRRVLGTAIPPPPADAGSIPADDVLADGKTVRERLAAHRRNATCANCHSRIDPLGFSLENYDATGRWRSHYRDRQEIDPSGTLSDGKKLAGPTGLRRYLQHREKDFRRTLCGKLLGYALGRSEIVTDRVLISQMMAEMKQDDRLAHLIVKVVTSPQFRRLRGRQTR